MRDWDDRVGELWDRADETDPSALKNAMAALIAERPPGNPDALFEAASVHDFLGEEAEAVPLDRAALHGGLTGARRPQAVIQLASSLRNTGDAAGAIELLRAAPADEITGSAAQAFLALALRDAGRSDEALRVVLEALAATLPMYGRAVLECAGELGTGAETELDSSGADWSFAIGEETPVPTAEGQDALVRLGRLGVVQNFSFDAAAFDQLIVAAHRGGVGVDRIAQAGARSRQYVKEVLRGKVEEARD